MANQIYEKVIKLLNEYKIDYKERLNSITLKCPICFKYKLDINKNQGYYICYHCADKDNIKGRNPAFILSKILNRPYSELKFQLTYFDTEDIESNFVKKETTSVVQEISKPSIEIKWPNHFFRINLEISIPGLNYLNFRGIDLQTAKKHELRYNPQDWQIVFPVFYDQILVGYQCRSVLKEIPKQFSKITMPGFQKANYLMFEKTINQDQVILAEGPISALKFEKTNVPFVATMGKYVSANQMKRLAEKGIKKIYLALDRDAYTETLNLIKNYGYVFKFYKVNVPEHRDDFGDCTFDECVLAYQEAYIATVNNLFPPF